MITRTGPRTGPRTAWLVLAAAALAAMMDGIDATALAVANPVLALDLHATLPELEALTIGYMLAVAMALIPAGALADRIGYRRVFLAGLAGLAGFTVSSVLVGTAEWATLMAAWRVVQGAAGAMIAASALGLLRHAFTPERLKVAIGLWRQRPRRGRAGRAVHRGRHRAVPALAGDLLRQPAARGARVRRCRPLGATGSTTGQRQQV